MIELKTEPASHREGQIDQYLELGNHHHPQCHVDLIYVTRDLVAGVPKHPSVSSHYCNVTWHQVAELIDAIWAESTAEEGIIAEYLTHFVRNLSKKVGASSIDEKRPQTRVVNPSVSRMNLEDALALAKMVQEDHEQRAFGSHWSSAEELEHCRDELNRFFRQLESGAERVRAWIWSASSSGGRPLTKGGAETGFELRFSYYK